REGAAHQFYGPANATDLWSIKKVNPQSIDPLDGEAGGAGCTGNGVFLATRRERSGSVRRQWLHAYRCRADRTEGIHYGVGSAVLRCDCSALAGLHGKEGGTARFFRRLFSNV